MNGTLERYQLQSWLNFISTEIHKQFTPLFKPTTTAEVRQGQVDLLGKPYLTGETFTVADAYVFTVVNWTNFVKIGLGPWPELQKFQARVAARPAVQQAL